MGIRLAVILVFRTSNGCAIQDGEDSLHLDCTNPFLLIIICTEQFHVVKSKVVPREYISRWAQYYF